MAAPRGELRLQGLQRVSPSHRSSSCFISAIKDLATTRGWVLRGWVLRGWVMYNWVMHSCQPSFPQPDVLSRP